MSGENIFYTGGAGTGKSTLLLLIIEKLNIKHGKHTVYVTATTGLAACAIGGTTVQQFAGMLYFMMRVCGLMEELRTQISAFFSYFQINFVVFPAYFLVF